MVKVKLKGTTIVEALIALVVIAVAFGAGMMTVERMWNTQRMAMNYRVQRTVESLAIEVKQQQQYSDETHVFDDFTVEQSIQFYQNNSQIIQLSLMAYDFEERLIHEQHELIYSP